MARRHNKPTHSPPTFHLETLERRILFSADAAWTALDIMPQRDAELVMQRSQSVEAANDESFQAGEVKANELVIVDSALGDLKKRLDDQEFYAGKDLQVVALNAHSDALAQISQILTSHRDLTALHIMSHGSSGAQRMIRGSHSSIRWRA